MSWKIVMTTDIPAWDEINQAKFNEIDAEFIKRQCNNEEEIIELAHDADAIVAISFYHKFGRQVIEKLQHCKIIANIGIGYEGIDVEAAIDHGICVSNVADYCLDEVAEHAIALMLAWARRLFPLDRLVREGKWTIERPEMRNGIWPNIRRLRYQTLGLIGFGRISQTLVSKAKGLVSRILAYDPYVSPDLAAEFGVEFVDLDRLISESDFISIHTNLTPQSKGLIGTEQLKTMKPTAFLINTARGGVVDANALYHALTTGQIAGAALDVTEPEPPDPDNPLLQLENVIITGHSAHASVESREGLLKGPVEEIIRVYNGQWPKNFVNPGVKAKFRERWGQ